MQRGIGTRYLLGRVGTTQKVLVQGAARRGVGRLSGWTGKRETVVLAGGLSLVGEIVPVRITGLSGITLHGVVEEGAACGGDLPLELTVLDAGV
jgi:tRNA-2-methylthio-N6-dimethylallyladenosine synthase